MSRTRVVVTGIGATTPSVATSPAPGTRSSPAVPASGPSTDDWAADLPVRIAGRVAVEPTEVLARARPAGWTAPRSSR